MQTPGPVGKEQAAGACSTTVPDLHFAECLLQLHDGFFIEIVVRPMPHRWLQPRPHRGKGPRLSPQPLTRTPIISPAPAPIVVPMNVYWWSCSCVASLRAITALLHLAIPSIRDMDSRQVEGEGSDGSAPTRLLCDLMSTGRYAPFNRTPNLVSAIALGRPLLPSPHHLLRRSCGAAAPYFVVPLANASEPLSGPIDVLPPVT